MAQPEGNHGSGRHNFDKSKKENLGRRTGGKCSMCGCPTWGPNEDVTKVTNIGQAAHITGAAKGGPRYDEDLSKEERSSILNGMWLCKNCHEQVDSNPSKYNVEMLKEMKKKAEMEAEAQLGVAQNVPKGIAMNALLCMK